MDTEILCEFKQAGLNKVIWSQSYNVDIQKINEDKSKYSLNNGEHSQ